MGFSVDWLTLREPADRDARDAPMLHRAAGCAGGGYILDLGCGTGATARAFGSLGHENLAWRFFDNDPALLEVAQARHPGAEVMQGDLGDLDALPLAGVSLVTASALLDLMPHNWVAALAALLRHEGIAFYAALTFDGQMRWTPAHDADASIEASFNDHQRGDKGLGKALGPDSGAATMQLFGSCGFDVTSAQSPWIIKSDQPALQRALIEGIGQAAAETGHPDAAKWSAARLDLAGQTTAVIGHTDVLALPGKNGI
jgi:SAM-dependent methyltransferase